MPLKTCFALATVVTDYVTRLWDKNKLSKLTLSGSKSVAKYRMRIKTCFKKKEDNAVVFTATFSPVWFFCLSGWIRILLCQWYQ